jgi:putative transposase
MRYKSCKAGADELVRDRLRCLAQERPRFGWRRLKILLKREKIVMNHKRLRRIYREESLQVRPRKKRRVRLIRGNSAPAPTKLNEEWGLDSIPISRLPADASSAPSTTLPPCAVTLLVFAWITVPKISPEQC